MVIFKSWRTLKYRPHIYPSLQLSGRIGRFCVFFIINHYIWPITQFPQRVYPFQILFNSCIKICQNIHSHLAPIPSGQFRKHLKFRNNLVPVLVSIPCKMNVFNLNSLYHFGFFFGHKSNINTLRKIHPCTGVNQLLQNIFPVRASYGIRIKQDYILLTVPKLR